MASPRRYTDQYLLRFPPGEREELQALAEQAGVSLADAMRTGTRSYLEELAGEQESDDSLVLQLNAVAARIDRRMRGS